MPISSSLPGFTRLIAICQQHSLSCTLDPPLASVLEQREVSSGEPLDPQLADAQGIQPVIYIDFMDSLTIAPVASSVDRFFDTYSRYLELMVVDPQYIQSGVSEVSFPWGVPQLIARDEPLLKLVRAGRFDFLTEEDEAGRKWMQRLLEAGAQRL